MRFLSAQPFLGLHLLLLLTDSPLINSNVCWEWFPFELFFKDKCFYSWAVLLSSAVLLCSSGGPSIPRQEALELIVDRTLGSSASRAGFSVSSNSTLTRSNAHYRAKELCHSRSWNVHEVAYIDGLARNCLRVHWTLLKMETDPVAGR